jgi:hypothetical protein
MLRRYLIVNGIKTALIYAAVWAFVPSVSGLAHAADSTFQTFAMESPLLGPLFYRIVTVSGR